MTERSAAGQLNQGDLEGAALTVSTLEVDNLVEVVQPAQSATLAIGKGTKQVVPDEAGNPLIATICRVTLSCDNRLMNEPLAAKFLSSFKKYVTQPHFL